MKTSAIFLYFFVLLCQIATGQPRRSAFISANISNSAGKSIYLNNKPLGGMDEGFRVIKIDSGISDVNNTVQFEMKLSEARVVSLEVQGDNRWLPFIISPGDSVSITGSIEAINRSAIVGSRQDSLIKALKKNIINPILNSMPKQSMPADTLNYYLNRVHLAQIEFVMQHKSDYASLLLLKDLARQKMPDSSTSIKARTAFTSLNKELQQSSLGLDVAYLFFELPNKYIVGKTIEAFKIINIDKTNFDFASILKENKYVLIDFWATWCKPCIAQFPELNDLYLKYKPIGFDIVSISADGNMNQYADFMAKNKLPWTFVADGFGTNSPIIKKFGISKYPSNLLVNTKGKIVGVDLSTGEIAKYLKEE